MLKMNLKNLILIIFSVLVVAGGVEAKNLRKSPTMRHAKHHKKAPKSPKMAVNRQVSELLLSAEARAERLDLYVQELLQLSSMTAWKRWSQNKDIDSVKKEFSFEMQNHLALMAEIFKIRGRHSRLPQYQEFEFQNLLRKSDYLLSLEFSRDSLNVARKNKDFSTSFGKTLISYNEQRYKLDGKTIEVKL